MTDVNHDRELAWIDAALIAFFAFPALILLGVLLDWKV